MREGKREMIHMDLSWRGYWRAVKYLARKAITPVVVFLIGVGVGLLLSVLA